MDGIDQMQALSDSQTDGHRSALDGLKPIKDGHRQWSRWLRMGWRVELPIENGIFTKVMN